jgi:hypothetical protein
MKSLVWTPGRAAQKQVPSASQAQAVVRVSQGPQEPPYPQEPPHPQEPPRPQVLERYPPPLQEPLRRQALEQHPPYAQHPPYPQPPQESPPRGERQRQPQALRRRRHCVELCRRRPAQLAAAP